MFSKLMKNSKAVIQPKSASPKDMANEMERQEWRNGAFSPEGRRTWKEACYLTPHLLVQTEGIDIEFYNNNVLRFHSSKVEGFPTMRDPRYHENWSEYRNVRNMVFL
jgi:hypothetical protein